MTISVGDRVHRTDADERVLGPAIVLCIHEDAAWIGYDTPSSDRPWRYRSVDLADLEPAEASDAAPLSGTRARMSALGDQLLEEIERAVEIEPHPAGYPKAEPPIVGEVRRICGSLLDAAKANGLGGCPLCQG